MGTIDRGAAGGKRIWLPLLGRIESVPLGRGSLNSWCALGPGAVQPLGRALAPGQVPL